MSGHMGDERVTQRGLRVAEVDAERNLLLIAGPSRVGRRRGRDQERRLMAALSPNRCRAGRPPSWTLEIFGLERNDALVHQVVTAELAARRQGTHRPRPAAWWPGAVPSRGARRAPAAPARARPAPRSGPAAASCSARTRAATPARSTARRASRRCGSRFGPRGRRQPGDGGRRKSTSQRQARAVELLAGWRSERPLVVVVARGEDALIRRSATWSGTLRRRDRRARGGRPGLGALADRVARRRWRCSKAVRRSERRSPLGAAGPGGVREELRHDRGARQVHLPRPSDAHKTQIGRPSRSCSRSTWRTST